MPTSSAFALISLCVLVLLVTLQPLTGTAVIGLPRQRITRQIIVRFLEFLLMAVIVTVLNTTFASSLRPFLVGSGSVAAIGSARSALAHHSVAGAITVSVLVIVAGVAIAGQYLAFNTFSGRKIGLSMDAIGKATGRAERIVRAFGATVTASLAEETIFRAVLPAALYAATRNLWIAILAPLVVFIAMHYKRRGPGLFNAALLGVAATAIYLVTEQLWLAILLHSTANLLSTIVAPEVRRVLIRRIARRALESQPGPVPAQL